MYLVMYPHQCGQLGITEDEMDLLILLIDNAFDTLH